MIAAGLRLRSASALDGRSNASSRILAHKIGPQPRTLFRVIADERQDFLPHFTASTEDDQSLLIQLVYKENYNWF